MGHRRFLDTKNNASKKKKVYVEKKDLHLSQAEPKKTRKEPDQFVKHSDVRFDYPREQNKAKFDPTLIDIKIPPQKERVQVSKTNFPDQYISVNNMAYDFPPFIWVIILLVILVLFFYIFF